MPSAAPPPGHARHVVTAVLVAHDGARWLPRTVAGLRAQTRPPERLVAVDTGSRDGSAALLADLLGGGLPSPDAVVAVAAAPRPTGFGAAVRLGLRELAGRAPAPDDPAEGVVEWLWLLHDDCEPEPDALEALVAHVATSPTVGIAGPKVRGWNDRRLLLEAGLTIARSGRRETGLERREHDQGQHDGVHDVLAVGTAGMLVRRDVWDALGGLDPVLPVFRDDVDLGWRANLAGHRVVCVTDAVVHHAEAAAHRRRHLAAAVDRPHRVDRRNALYVLLANLPLTALPWAVLRLVAGTLLRIVGLLAGKLPGHALDELLALAGALGRPDRLVRARLARRRTRVLPARAVRSLLASRGAGVRHGLEALSALFAASGSAPQSRRHHAVETGPASEDAEDLSTWSSGLLRQVLTRPVVLLTLGLGLVGLLAARDLLGGGRLMGGALLPAPDSAGQLWATYIRSWHPVGVGSDTVAPPYLAVVAALGTLLLGNVSLAVDLLLLAAVPLAGLTAYVAIRRVVASVPLRVWAAATYALLPSVTGAVAAGRLGTAVLAVLLPLLGLAGGRAVGVAGRAGSYRAAWAGGLVLAVAAAFVPVAYPMAVVLAGAAALWLRGRGLPRLLILLAVPPVLLLPWLPALVADPALLLLEGGFPGPALSDARLHPVAVLLVHPGGPGMYPLALSVGLLLAGLAALLRSDRRALIGAGWAAALVGLATGLLVSRARVTAPTLENPVAAWPGPGLLLAGAGLLLAAVVGGDGAGRRVSRSSFGWRQPATVALTVLAAVTPVLAAGWWVGHGAAGPLERRDPVLLPAFVAAEGQQPDRPRTLVLRPRGNERLAYALLRADGPRLGDAETAPPNNADTGLDGVVADLASGRGGDAAARLLPYGVRFVLLGRPVDAGLARAVDAVPGLVRLSGPGGSVLWKVSYPTGRARLVDEGSESTTEKVPRGSVLPADEVRVRATIPAGGGDRLVALADPRGGGWRATLDGTPLPPRTYDGWAQAFALPHAGGRLDVGYDAGLRPVLLWAQGIAVLLVLLLALPGVRTADDADDAPPVAALQDTELVASRP